jgi:pyrroline-5-carboxylate reductase
MDADIRVGCIGCGVMGSALMRAIRKQLPGSHLTVTDVDFKKAAVLAEELGCTAVADNYDVVKCSAQVFLAVKPQFMNTVLSGLAGCMYGPDAGTVIPLFVSIAAGTTLDSLRAMLRNAIQDKPLPANAEFPAFIRLMPNLPALVGEAMIALCAGPDVSQGVVDTVSQLLSAAGKVERVPETLMDAVTAISGSGPAYGFMFIEALADAAVRFGIPRSQAYVYAAQTLKGAAAMVLETGRHPAELKDAVCSPAGTTIEAVRILEDTGFRSAILSAASAAWQRSIQLGKV